MQTVNGNLTAKYRALIAQARRRHGRKKHGLCICEGVKCCRELLSLRPELVRAAVCREGFDSTEFKAAEPAAVGREEFDSLSSMENSEGIFMLAEIPPMEGAGGPAPRDNYVAVLDRISDPGNLGTIVRTARAAGLRELWITSGTSDPFNEKAIRAALAAQFAMGFRKFSSLGEAVCELRRHGHERIFITVPRGGSSCFAEENLFSRSAIVFGNEARGADVLPGTETLSIPMPGAAESINVAQAFTVIVFEAIRRSCKALGGQKAP